MFIDSTEEKLSDLDLILLSTTKHSSFMTLRAFSFSILANLYAHAVCLSIYYMPLLPTLTFQQKRSGKITCIYYLFGGFLTLYLKKNAIIYNWVLLGIWLPFNTVPINLSICIQSLASFRWIIIYESDDMPQTAAGLPTSNAAAWTPGYSLNVN